MLSRFKIPIGWGELLKRTYNETLADDVLNLAAQQAYYFFFALFPALLALISIASFFPVDNLMKGLTTNLARVAPGDVVEIVSGQLQKIANDNAGGLLTLAFIFTLWSSSGAVVSMCSTLNAAYDITEGRPWWKVRLVAIGLTLGLAVFVLVSMTLVIGGPWIAEQVADRAGLGAAFEWTWKIAQWPLVFVLVATALAFLYYFAPDAEQDWVWLTPGSILATTLWLGISLGFKYYISNFGNYTETYGLIGGVMVLMLWFYLSGIAILVGAELNSEIEHASPYGKDVGEKVPGEKKKIGPAAERRYEEQKAKGAIPIQPFPAGVNCDIESGRTNEDRSVRPSDLLIGTAVLLPAAIKVGLDVKKQISGGSTPKDGSAD
ncbi:MAG: YihY/virulence factor BrkB family protein [Acidobacteriota bacterium]|nr:YihY/virulence factor BrkB family protein [Acidobacteriota bacterium]MDQ3420561.1 YihY/virulence factor BrkB family protein [Acidobacteriota bacterium]